MNSPFLFREAKLPDGFPPPGPVNQVIIKEYPACRAAIAKSKDLGNAGEDRLFRSLFNHIQRNDIPMTAPVEMEYSDANQLQRPLSMAFLYRQTAVGKPGPDQDVTVVDLPPVRVLSVGLRGGYSKSNYQKGMKLLQDFLAAHPGEYRPGGPPRFLGYNSPFVPWFLRYGELQLPIAATPRP